MTQLKPFADDDSPPPQPPAAKAHRQVLHIPHPKKQTNNSSSTMLDRQGNSILLAAICQQHITLFSKMPTQGATSQHFTRQSAQDGQAWPACLSEPDSPASRCKSPKQSKALLQASSPAAAAAARMLSV
jgi:hypothetical protein